MMWLWNLIERLTDPHWPAKQAASKPMNTFPAFMLNVVALITALTAIFVLINVVAEWFGWLVWTPALLLLFVRFVRTLKARTLF